MNRITERISQGMGYPVSPRTSAGAKEMLEFIKKTSKVEKRMKKARRRNAGPSMPEDSQPQVQAPEAIPEFTIGPNGALILPEEQ